MKKLTTEEFIKKAKAVHGDKYDYYETNYIESHKKLKIICPIHGVFFQTPNSHLNNRGGCPVCSNNQTIPLKTLIERANEVHNNIYDYSKVRYKNKSEKVEIICPIHGSFNKSLENHINKKQGCPKCSGRYRTTEDFIKLAAKKHDSKFDYSDTVYSGANKKIKIICPTHGTFFQKALLHLNSLIGCPKCAKNTEKTTEEFVNSANKVHNYKYIYTKTNYKKSYENVIIICPVHGEFQQTPSNHTNNKQGCPHCKTSKGENEVKNLLIVNNIDFKQQYKFKDCKYKLPLPFDFYLPDRNICVEYDGEQHFRAAKLFGGEKAFESCKIKDQIKTDYCLKNNIPLIRIRYDENIEDVLSQKLMLK